MARFAIAVAALAMVLAVANAHCPNSCNGHGDCHDVNKCSCWSRWTGGDCSLRKCPTGPSWADPASADEVAHQAAECSDRGMCDHSTGICKCFDGFEGLGCNRMTCNNDCNGHGRCRSMKYHAANADRSYSKQLPGHENLAYTANWDANMVWGCECDEGYQGYDCSLRVCANGDDPLTTSQLNERQVFVCRKDPSSGETFAITYRGHTTAAIPVNANAALVKAELEMLPTIRGVDVDFKGTGASVCDNTADNEILVEFLKEYGDVGHLLVYEEQAPLLLVHPMTDFTFAYDGVDIDGVTSVTATKESEPCSNRGFCDTKTGFCTCYTGYETSNGEAVSGDRGDCGYAATPITECPGTTSCSGHGVCSGHPTYRCTCDKGWTGGDCSERTCPFGFSWFDVPTETANSAHAWAECSNMGICNRETGECQCRKWFEGSACERTTCPGGRAPAECNGHGKCLSMKQLAEYSLDNGESTDYTYGLTPNDPAKWDYNKMYGCWCDEGYEGYDCSQRTCPTGDDITTSDQDKEMQIIECTTATSGSFQLHFRTYDTATLASTATEADVKAALEALPSIETVTVVYSEAGPFCTDGVTPNYVQVTFDTELGDVPPISETMDDANLAFAFYNDGTSAGGIPSVKGTMENAECSDRGLCDHSTGQCQCFVGFGSSDGSGNRGGRGDCGYRLPFVPVKPGLTTRWVDGIDTGAGTSTVQKVSSSASTKNSPSAAINQDAWSVVGA